MQSVKTIKRRVVQRTIETLGKSSDGIKLDEAEFKAAVENFKQLELDVRSILDLVKSSRQSTIKFTERNQELGTALAAFFSSDNSPASLKTAAYEISRLFTRSHNNIQASCGRILDDNMIEPLTQLLTERFPLVKKRITQHTNLETDLASYNRRVKGLMEKGKKEGDPDYARFKEKFDRTNAAYVTLHKELLSELRVLYGDRHNTLRRAFVTILAVQAELQQQLSDDMNRVLKEVDRGDVQAIRNDIATMISSGGPPTSPGAANGASGANGGLATSGTKLKSLLSSVGGSFSSRGRAGSGPTATTVSSSNGAAPLLTSPPQSLLNSSSMSTSGGGSGSGWNANPISSSSSLDNSSASLHDVAAGTGSRRKHATTDSGTAGEEEVVEMEVALALFDYNGTDEGDLSFQKGDTILVQEKIDEGWWRGVRDSDGTFGLFPSNYVALETS